MIKDIPLDGRIAVIGIDRASNFDWCLEWAERFKTENPFEKRDELNRLFDHIDLCICCIADSLEVKNGQVVCEMLACGRFRPGELLGEINTKACGYLGTEEIRFLGDRDRRYMVFDGTGRLVAHSGLVPDLWRPETFVETVGCYINDDDYIALDDICP